MTKETIVPGAVHLLIDGVQVQIYVNMNDAISSGDRAVEQAFLSCFWCQLGGGSCYLLILFERLLGYTQTEIKSEGTFPRAFELTWDGGERSAPRYCSYSRRGAGTVLEEWRTQPAAK